MVTFETPDRISGTKPMWDFAMVSSAPPLLVGRNGAGRGYEIIRRVSIPLVFRRTGVGVRRRDTFCRTKPIANLCFISICHVTDCKNFETSRGSGGLRADRVHGFYRKVRSRANPTVFGACNFFRTKPTRNSFDDSTRPLAAENKASFFKFKPNEGFSCDFNEATRHLKIRSIF